MIWVAYLTAIGYGIDTAVWINIDETPIPYHFGGRHGWKKHKPPDTMKQSMVERATLQLQRSHCTLLASIASRTDVQNVLPQILLPKVPGGKKWNTVSSMETKPDNVDIIMGSNGWMDMKMLKQCLEKLRAAMVPLDVNKVVIVMDCHPSHYAWKTLALLRHWKGKVLLLPSKLTGVLQPLDVSIFADFKKKLHVANMKSNISRPDSKYNFETLGKKHFVNHWNYFQKLGCKNMLREMWPHSPKR
jgi:hypothetical protein